MTFREASRATTTFCDGCDRAWSYGPNEPTVSISLGTGWQWQ